MYFPLIRSLRTPSRRFLVTNVPRGCTGSTVVASDNLCGAAGHVIRRTTPARDFPQSPRVPPERTSAVVDVGERLSETIPDLTSVPAETAGSSGLPSQRGRRAVSPHNLSERPRDVKPPCETLHPGEFDDEAALSPLATSRPSFPAYSPVPLSPFKAF